MSPERPLDPASRPGECALLLLRIFRGLDAMLGSIDGCRTWMAADNTHLRGVPAELVRSVEGLVHVTRYLDAMRGKL